MRASPTGGHQGEEKGKGGTREEAEQIVPKKQPPLNHPIPATVAVQKRTRRPRLLSRPPPSKSYIHCCSKVSCPKRENNRHGPSDHASMQPSTIRFQDRGLVGTHSRARARRREGGGRRELAGASKLTQSPRSCRPAWWRRRPWRRQRGPSARPRARACRRRSRRRSRRRPRLPWRRGPACRLRRPWLPAC
ncbi:uncharacterized protein K452DRAFT_119569 [Aplosporella prunicola CBS 121167]|uniref:Uncharacterized protein n=1 Tax=Aplosporella prunicola CBS 121167 TaxID=1176127 RepID=A0A6A6BRF8_9PEZI|nr:uncharacterized protein K452DRAFT_119569 [Aplosporella prunicola CBS 121167]KAF2145407.1 hypothetical protein K452DRAFT_119569 [Aplosporella prunicola CBS 121167]